MLWLGALVGVPIVFGVWVFALYWLALRQGGLPSTVYPAWYLFISFAACLVAGLVLVYFTSLRPIWLRVLAGIFYAAAMPVVLLAVQALVACYSGDCI
jgi:hypothetical protein